MKEIKFAGLPAGTTETIITQFRKSCKTKSIALTETVDGSIDAVNNTKGSVININYDKVKGEIKVSDYGYGVGMNKETCLAVTESFTAHCFDLIGGISRFGKGRFYPWSIMGKTPNAHYRTSTGDGSEREIIIKVNDIKDDSTWVREINEYSCPKGIHGTEVTYEDVDLSDEELAEMKRMFEVHYAMCDSTILFNGEVLTKNNPCHLEYLPNSIDTPDGIYLEKGIVFYVKTLQFKKEESKVRIKVFAVMLTCKVDNVREESSVGKGGVYGMWGSNILNKGNNSEAFFNRIFTRGGCGRIRYFFKVYEDDENILSLNDVKALGFEPFYPRKSQLNEYQDDKGNRMFNVLADIFSHNCRLYDKIGQKKHVTMSDEAMYAVAQNEYNGISKKVQPTKIVNSVRQSARDAHVNYIEKVSDYVIMPGGNTVISITPKNRTEEVSIVPDMTKINKTAWDTDTKEDFVCRFVKWVIENDLPSSYITDFNKFLMATYGEKTIRTDNLIVEAVV